MPVQGCRLLLRHQQGSALNEPRPDVYRHIWQAYGTYVFDLGRGLTMDFGKFASSLGFETNYAKDNSQFSRAFLFGFLPFYHSGVRLSLPVNDRVTLMYMLTNGVQQTEDFNSFKSNHVAVVFKAWNKVVWTVNYSIGQEQPDGNQPDGPDGFFRVFDTYAASSATIGQISRTSRRACPGPFETIRTRCSLASSGGLATRKVPGDSPP